MIINPIIPVWLMGILCVVFLIFKRKGIVPYIRQILIVIMLFVINLRPMIPNKTTQTVSSNVDVLFVVDNTISMLAEDYDGDGRRMDAVKEDCKYIMEQFPGASYSVVSFGDSVTTVTPYTMDVNITHQALDSLNGEVAYSATGTSLNGAMEKLDKSLNNGRDTCQVVFFISDGEITTDEKLKSYPDISQYVQDGAVLGYGTDEGGPMKASNYLGDEEPDYIETSSGRAKSKIDEENLESIADDIGVDYIHMTDQSKIDNKIDKILSNIQNETYTEEIISTEGSVDIYYFFVIPLVALLIFDFIYYKRKIGKSE